MKRIDILDPIGIRYLWKNIKTLVSTKVDKVSSSTDNAIVRFDGTLGDIQNSGVTIDDSNHLTAAKLITSGGTSSQFVKGDGSLDSNSYLSRSLLESRGENLIYNGNGFLGDNTNFSSLIFDGTKNHGSKGSFTRTSTTYATPYSTYSFPLNPNEKYKVSVDGISSNNAATMYIFIDFRDVDGRQIRQNQVRYVEASTTTLAQDLKNGDTTIYLTNVSGWSTASTSAAYLGVIVWDITNSYGYTYQPGEFGNVYHGAFTSGATIDLTNNSIPLSTAWSHGTIPAGTKISQSNGGATYTYVALAGTKIPTTWTSYSGYVTPPGGTAVGYLGFLWNYNSANDQVWLTNLSVTAHASQQDISAFVSNTSTDANSLISKLPTWTATPTDGTYLIRRDTGGAASFGQVTFATVWAYIVSKISSVLGIGGSNGTPTAPTAASGTNTTQIATTAFVKGEVDIVEKEIPKNYVVDYSKQYLTFEALENGTFSFTDTNTTYQYSLDNGKTWNSLASDTASPTVNAGNTIMWKREVSGFVRAGIFGSTGNFNVCGNIMSLYFGDNFIGQKDLTGRYGDYRGNDFGAFELLFADATKLINAHNLILPATTLAAFCYSGMFSGCTSLVSTPKLPATTLAEGCYLDMFGGCTSLTTAPDLPALTLVQECYRYMFRFCSSLNYIKCLATDISASFCTSDWLRDVSSTGTFVKADSMTSWQATDDGTYTWTVKNVSDLEHVTKGELNTSLGNIETLLASI
jgi:hypothetical protein